MAKRKRSSKKSTRKKSVSKAKRSRKKQLPFQPGDPERCRWFTDARFGMFIHWGIYAIPARGEWVMQREEIPVKQYEKFFDRFDPANYDPAVWAGLAREAGMKYMVLTTKHHDGFCLFDSKLTDYKAPNTKAGRDLVAEYVDAARAEGLKVGFYYSLLDWHHPHYTIDPVHALRNDEKAGKEKRDWAKYIKYMHGQVRELMTNYGQIDVLWCDFSYGDKTGDAWRAHDLLNMVFELQPQIMVNNRLGVAGDIETPEQRIPNVPPTRDGKPVIWETCMTLNEHWGYAEDDRNYKSATQAIRMLVDCVSKGGNLLLNVGPRPDGSFPTQSVIRLKQIGRWMDANAESIYGCGPAPTGDLPYGRATMKGRKLYVHVFDWPEDGKVKLPPFRTKARSASLLKGDERLKLRQTGKSITITGPEEAPAWRDAAVAVEFERKPGQCGDIPREKIPTVRASRWTGKAEPFAQLLDSDAWNSAFSWTVKLKDGVLTSVRAYKPGDFRYTVRAMHRNDTLFVAVEAKRNGPVCAADTVGNGDGVEVLIDGALDGRWITNNKRSFRLLVSADGSGEVADEDPDSGVFWRALGNVDGDKFRVVTAIPFTSILNADGEPVKAGDVIGFNVCGRAFGSPGWEHYTLWWQASGGTVVIDRSQWGRMKLAGR
jgi:alpha-L-fucosidase